MSIAFESPSQRRQGGDTYFTPLTVPNSILTTNSTSYSNNLLSSNNNDNTINNEDETSGGTTPYFTAPISPMLHQDFLNAIHQRHSTQPTVFTPTLERKPVVTFATGGSIADRRRAKLQQQIQQQQQQQQQQQLPSSIYNNNASTTPSSVAGVTLVTPDQLADYLSKQRSILLLDVRSFVQFSHARIRQAINVSIPNTILKRPTFTMEKVYEAIVEGDRPRLKQWSSYDSIVFYDQSSTLVPEQSATCYLACKMIRSGFSGSLSSLQGGFDAFHSLYPDHCILTPPTPPANGHSASNSLPFLRNKLANGLKTPSLHLGSLPPSSAAPLNIGPYTAPMPHFENQAFNPFFSNIRQNMELSHGPIKERFPIRLPPQCHAMLLDDRSLVIEIDSLETMPRAVAGATLEKNKQGKNIFKVPHWLQRTMVDNDTGELSTISLAKLYEKLERTEQRRLQNIMHFHSKDTNSDPLDYPLSIVAGIEMGALNRYTNIWPFEYTRVKIHDTPRGSTGYINASYIQYYQHLTTTTSTNGLSNRHSSNSLSSDSMAEHDSRPHSTTSSSTVTTATTTSSIESSPSKIATSSPLSSVTTMSSPVSASSPTKSAASSSPTSSASSPSSVQAQPTCLKMMKSSQWHQQPYRRYISTQGPLPSTFDDFWQVVWEQNSRVVVMLTKEEEMNKIKCHRYWPSDINQSIQYGPTRLTLIAEKIHKVEYSDWKEDIIYEREFTVEKLGKPVRRITQLHYTGWMDYGVPDNPLGTLQLVQLADQAQRQYESASVNEIIGPMVIHCSAGCGRSGAFCAIDTVLRRLTLTDHSLSRNAQQEIDALWEIIYMFREQRLSMVQTLRQFVFCYEVVWWWFLGYGRQQDKDSMEI